MNHPKIGIWPTIDGRQGGVREGLEEKTMAMAYAAKKLIEQNLFYKDGTPVSCIVPSTTIGGRSEAAKVSAEFQANNVIATLAVTPSWCYGTETLDLDPNWIKAIWGFNGTERPGAVYLAAAMSAYNQKGIPAFKIYGKDVQELNDDSIPIDVQEKILRFAKAVLAVGQLQGKSYVNIGASSMGIAGSQISTDFFEKYLGMTVEFVDMTEILRRMTLKIYDETEYQVLLDWIGKNCPEGIDINAQKEFPEIISRSKVIPADEDWRFIAKQTIIMKDILLGNPNLAQQGWVEESAGRNAIAGGFQGQRQWTDWLPNGDFAEALLASTFGWTGPKEPLAFATENDSLNAASMLFCSLLSNQAAIFSDVRTYWSPEAVERVTGKQLDGPAAKGILHLINSGASALDGTMGANDDNGQAAMKPFWKMTDADITACLDKTTWCRANYEYFRGGGFSSNFNTDVEAPITMIRLNLVHGIGPSLQIAEGTTCRLDGDIHEKLDERTDKTWPTTWFAPRLGEEGFESVYQVMNLWGANHCAWTYGHIGADLITLANMLRIPVSMHNIPKEDLFRTSLSDGFGTKALEAVDLELCKNLGPRY